MDTRNFSSTHGNRPSPGCYSTLQWRLVSSLTIPRYNLLLYQELCLVQNQDEAIIAQIEKIQKDVSKDMRYYYY